MRTENSRRIEDWEDDFGLESNIIYLCDHTETDDGSNLKDYRKILRRRRPADKADRAWNAVFIVACLSVLVVLFLH
jgi:hypothetical protein